MKDKQQPALRWWASALVTMAAFIVAGSFLYKRFGIGYGDAVTLLIVPLLLYSFYLTRKRKRVPTETVTHQPDVAARKKHLKRMVCLAAIALLVNYFMFVSQGVDPFWMFIVTVITALIFSGIIAFVSNKQIRSRSS